MRTRSINCKEISQLAVWGSEQCHKISESPLLDAEILLTHVLNKPRSYCRTWPEKIVSQEHIQQFEALIALRLKPTPIAYLVGYKEFWSRDFKVNAATLIPRPDTELLIEQALAFLNTQCSKQNILDLGTGTGCIAITLQKEFPDSHVIAADISKDALSIASENAKQHDANVMFIESSWFNKVPFQEFDLIVSNPPYIAKNDEHLKQGDLPAEPMSALASGMDGLDDLKIITEQAIKFLTHGGMLMVEHGYDQKEAVNALLLKQGFKDIKQYDDLGQQARVTSGLKT